MEAPSSDSTLNDNSTDTKVDTSCDSSSDIENPRLEGEELRQYLKALRRREHLIKVSKKSYGINIVHNKEKTKIFARILCQSNSEEECASQVETYKSLCPYESLLVSIRQNNLAFIFPDTTSMTHEEIKSMEGLDDTKIQTNPLTHTFMSKDEYEQRYDPKNLSNNGHLFAVGCLKYCDEYCLIIFSDYNPDNCTEEQITQDVQSIVDLFNISTRKGNNQAYNLGVRLVNQGTYFPIVENPQEIQELYGSEENMINELNQLLNKTKGDNEGFLNRLLAYQEKNREGIENLKKLMQQSLEQAKNMTNEELLAELETRMNEQIKFEQSSENQESKKQEPKIEDVLSAPVLGLLQMNIPEENKNQDQDKKHATQ